MRKCNEGASEQNGGMTGKRKLGARRYRYSAPRRLYGQRSRPTVPRRRLDMETDRLRSGDGRTRPRRPTAEKTERDRRFEGWVPTGHDVASHKRQGYDGSKQQLPF